MLAWLLWSFLRHPGLACMSLGSWCMHCWAELIESFCLFIFTGLDPILSNSSFFNPLTMCGYNSQLVIHVSQHRGTSNTTHHSNPKWTWCDSSSPDGMLIALGFINTKLNRMEGLLLIFQSNTFSLFRMCTKYIGIHARLIKMLNIDIWICMWK